MVTKQEINAKWWRHRSHESQALNHDLVTKAEDEQKLLAMQAKELKRIDLKLACKERLTKQCFECGVNNDRN